LNFGVLVEVDMEHVLAVDVTTIKVLVVDNTILK
jgi:hypothetical protein